MGVVLYTLLVGSKSFSFPRETRDDHADTPWDEPTENSPEYAEYLTGELLKYDPWTRIRGQTRGTIPTALSIMILADMAEVAILLGMLTVNPNRRITIEGIKSHSWSMTCVVPRSSRIALIPSLGRAS
jgi:serine/threonine-protein kinase Chk1